MHKKIIIVGTPRYSINFNDFWMFFSRSKHDVIKIFFPENSTRLSWFNNLKKADNARNSIVDSFDRSLVQPYNINQIEHLLQNIQQLNPDYICVGNGNCNIGKAITKRFKKKVLYSEYGWLPWSDHFYITRDGTSIDSDIAELDHTSLESIDINDKQINDFKCNFLSKQGTNDVKYQNFIYVPLQVDKNDFKFDLTTFKNNQEFLKFIDNIVPEGITLLVKHHPLNKNKCKIQGYKNIVDITDTNLNKLQLLEKMKGMICVNSTSVLEALCFNKPIFVYGKDIYLNKNIVFYDVRDKEEFNKKLNAPIDSDNRLKFITLLMSRQINRKKCIDNNLEYINNHYWNNSL